MCVLCALAVLDHAREKKSRRKRKKCKKKGVQRLSLFSKSTGFNPDSTRSQKVKKPQNRKIKKFRAVDILHAKTVDSS
jgi:hypothetical protein